jgi:hypothetical protein
MTLNLRHPCKNCRNQRLRRPVAYISGTEIKVQWLCRECDSVFVQVVGEVDFSQAEVANGEEAPSSCGQQSRPVSATNSDRNRNSAFLDF